MNRRQIHTIILQEKKIAELKERNRQLDSGHRSLWQENKRLRKRIRFLERNENHLSGVNV
jgi:FtsZ-binding cell division protein ZapB